MHTICVAVSDVCHTLSRFLDLLFRSEMLRATLATVVFDALREQQPRAIPTASPPTKINALFRVVMQPGRPLFPTRGRSCQCLPPTMKSTPSPTCACSMRTRKVLTDARSRGSLLHIDPRTRSGAAGLREPSRPREMDGEVWVPSPASIRLASFNLCVARIRQDGHVDRPKSEACRLLKAN